MQIVIDISDKDYEKLKDGHIPFSILDVMQNGIPLNNCPFFTNRKEQRQVVETMNALLLPMLPCFNEETEIIVKRALQLLNQIGIDAESEG